MATTLTALTSRAGRTAGAPGVRSVIATAGVAAIASAVAGEALRAAAVAAGVDLRAGMPGETGTMELTLGSFATMTLMCAVPAAALAALLARCARRPAEIFTALAVAATAISLLAPIAGNAPTLTTRAVLCLAHVLAAVVFVPPVVRRLSAAGAARRDAGR